MYRIQVLYADGTTRGVLDWFEATAYGPMSREQAELTCERIYLRCWGEDLASIQVIDEATGVVSCEYEY
jgi:hypothetical protein